MKAVNATSAQIQIDATLDAINRGLLGQHVDRIGTIGYCFGGGWSLQTALNDNEKIKACVMYYGFPEQNLDRLDALKAPLLGFFGTQDPRINPKVVGKFKSDLNTEHKEFYIFSYDAPHAFANPSNPHFNKQATEDSWKKTIAFFKRHLG
jgi:carboxymethylenebutenolidase